jgi:hypothetical protein
MVLSSFVRLRVESVSHMEPGMFDHKYNVGVIKDGLVSYIELSIESQ